MAMEGPVARATHAAKSLMYGDRLQTLDDLLHCIEGVMPEDVARLASEMFRPECCSLVVYGPPDEDSGEPLPKWEIAL
jgi:predicted Zn-dependent peptidase